MYYFRALAPVFLGFFCITLIASPKSKPTSAGVYDFAGIPPNNKLWTSSDYSTVASILTAKKCPLPTYSTSDGTELVARITSQLNLKYYNDSSIEIKIRMHDFGVLVIATNTIFNLYNKENLEHPYPEERAAMIRFIVYRADSGIALIDELSRNQQNQAPAVGQAFLFEQLYSNRVDDFKIAETAVTNDASINPNGVSIILKAMANVAERIKTHFADNYKRELIRKLNNLKQELTIIEGRKAIEEILEKLDR